MYNYLKGQLVSKVEASPTGCHITVDVNNIGYLIQTNTRTITELPDEGEIVTVYVSLIHREDALFLCGFSAREDRDLFNLLTTVSGVGTKVALAIMGEFSAHELVDAVLCGDDRAISRTKGVGPKLAQKIIIELKDKMTGWRDKVAVKSVAGAKGNASVEAEEAESVLISLGYTKKEIQDSMGIALSRAQDKKDAEELIRIALQWLAAQGG